MRIWCTMRKEGCDYMIATNSQTIVEKNDIEKLEFYRLMKQI